MTSQSAYCLSRENRILHETNDKQQISLGNFTLLRPLASLPVQNKCLKKFEVRMTSQSAYCLSRENRILDETNDKQQISLGNFQLIRPLASLPVQNKCLKKFEVRMTSQSAYCLSRENRILDETNDKQQISLCNFQLIRPLASLPVQNKCLEKVLTWRHIRLSQSAR